MVVQSSANGVKFSGNIVDSNVAVDPADFTKATVEWELLKNLPMPTSNNEALKLVQKIPQSPKVDMTGTERIVFVAGAFNLDNTNYPSTITSKSGPFWNPIIEEKAMPAPSLEPIIVEPGVETLSKAIKKAGAKGTLLLNAGTYLVEKSMKISGDVIIKGNGDNVVIKAADNLEKDFSYFFRVNEGARLKLDNVTVDGDGGIVKYAVVSPDENLSGAYTLVVENTYLQNFTNESGGAVFKAYAGTFADSIIFKNSVVQNSYRGLNLSYEKGFGKYSAEVVLLYNTAFKNMDEFAVNYTREGLNPANKGGQLMINHCVFSKVYNSEKGYILRTKGIENVEIKNSVFENSHLIVTSVNLSGLNNSVYNCLVYATGSIKTSNGAKSEDLQYKNPKWEDSKLFIPSSKSDLLKANNGIEEIGLVTPLKR
jgi:poly(beta-D-mannuronate) lyase